MANVWLEREDCRYGDFPNVCLKCGAEARDRVKKEFSWIPSWIYILIIAGLLIFVIVALVLRKTITAQLPMCPKHRSHWLWRLLAVLASIPLLIACIVGMAFASEWTRQNGLEGLELIGIFGSIFVWLITVVVISSTAIRCVEIADRRGLRLAGVSKAFIEAYDQVRHDRQPQLPDLDEQTRRWADRQRDVPRGDDEPGRFAPDDDEPRRRRREEYREE